MIGKGLSARPKSAILVTVLLLAACATSSPVGEWRDPDFSGRLDNILIIGVSENAERRRAFEDSFVGALAENQVTAIPSYTLIASASDLTRAGVEKAIEGRDIDAVLVTRLAGVEQGQIERLPTINRQYRSFSGYYDHVVQQNNAGYYSQFKVFSLESHLYETASKQLVWSMQSEVIDSSQPQQMIDDQIQVTITALGKQGLLGE